MKIPAWIKTPILSRAYNQLGLQYNREGISPVLAKFISRGKALTLIDAGAHHGCFTRTLAHYCGIDRGLLVEPQPAHAERLRREFQMPNYEVVQCALSNEFADIELEINEFDATSSILPMDRTSPDFRGIDVSVREKIKCQTQTLDSLVTRAGLSVVDLLKIDVQGAEEKLIEGATKTLRSTSLVWCEISFRPIYEGSAAFPAIYNRMCDAGFQLMALEPAYRNASGELLQADVLFLNNVNHA
jgi:FkbM family methyltransferase